MSSVTDRAIALVRDPNNPRSLSHRFRAARWQRVQAAFPELDRFSVLDLGGTLAAWRQAPVQPKSLTIVNLPTTGVRAATAQLPPGVRFVEADATGDLPELDERYDLVYSNSVIEHVGGYVQRRRFAQNVRRLGTRFWVQTPNRYFPIEPHWLFPGFQFLPLPTQAWVSCRWKLGHVRSADRDAGIDDARSTELIGETELRSLFPDGVIEREKAAGLTKSLVVRSSNGSPS